MIDPFWFGITLSVVALLVYLRTLCPTIYVGDSGELAAAAHVLGIPHPPGYPLYVILGKLFSLIVPVGSPALKLNLFSAVCSAASVAFVYFTLLALGLGVHISGGAAMAWAFSASLWSQSGIARVYALGAALAAAATWCAVNWYVEPAQVGWLIASAAIVGLGLANHPVAVVHVPAVATLVLIHAPRTLLSPAVWIGLVLAVVPPALLYFAWLPLRARSQPPVNWANIRNFADLRRFLSRKEYWRYRFVRSFGDAAEVISFYVRRIGVEFGFLGTAAIVVGLVTFAVSHPALFVTAALLFLLNMASMIAHARREDIFHWTRYMITAWFALIFPLAFGLSAIVAGLPASVQPWFAFAPAAVLFASQFRRQDLSRHRWADEYSRRILEHLPDGATLIAQDDNVVFPMMYLKYAEGLRPDVRLMEQGVHQLQEFRFNPKRDVVYCTHWQAAFNQPPTTRGPGLRLVNEGLIYRVVSTDMPFRPADLWSEGQHMLHDMDDPAIPRNYLTRCLLGHVYFMRAEWELPRDAVTAVAWYTRAARMAYDNAVMHYNIGLVYDRQGWTQLAADEFALAESIDRSYKRAPVAALAADARAGDRIVV